MKKNLLLILTVIALLSMPVTVCATEKKENDAFKFRGFEWGTTLEEIQEKEITDGMVEGVDYSLKEDAKSWVLKTEVASVNVYAWFEFDDDWKLNLGYYIVNEDHQTNSEYYSDFVRISNGLISLYGDVTSNFGVGFSSNDFDDLDGMTRDEILPVLEGGGGIQFLSWAANDGSMIIGTCYSLDGNLRVEYYYFKDYSQFEDILTNSVNTEGL